MELTDVGRAGTTSLVDPAFEAVRPGRRPPRGDVVWHGTVGMFTFPERAAFITAVVLGSLALTLGGSSDATASGDGGGAILAIVLGLPAAIAIGIHAMARRSRTVSAAVHPAFPATPRHSVHITRTHLALYELGRPVAAIPHARLTYLEIGPSGIAFAHPDGTVQRVLLRMGHPSRLKVMALLVGGRPPGLLDNLFDVGVVAAVVVGGLYVALGALLVAVGGELDRTLLAQGVATLVVPIVLAIQWRRRS